MLQRRGERNNVIQAVRQKSVGSIGENCIHTINGHPRKEP